MPSHRQPGRIALALLLGLFVLAEPSIVGAKQIAPISKSHLKGACKDSGGTFESNSKGAYACTKKDCDSAKDTCTIDCNKKGCETFIDIDISKLTVLGILQHGDNVNHSYGAVEPATQNHPEHDDAPKSGAAAGSGGDGCVPGATCRR